MIHLSATRYILLEVDSSKADELIAALVKRSYIKSVDLTKLEQRKLHTECPVCHKELTREWVATVTDQVVYGCLSILNGMKTNKSVVIYNKSYIEEVRPIDRPRSVPFPYKPLYTARLLGLVGHFVDGSQDTFYVTPKGIEFLAKDEPLTPCRVTVVDNTVLDSSGSMKLDDVKSKDRAKFSETVLRLREAVKALPETTLTFVRTGQVPLL